MGFRKDPLGYLAASALVQAGIYTAKAVRNLTAAEAIEAAAGLGLIASEVAPATAAAAATAAGYTAYRGGKYIYQSSKDEINWLKKTFGKKRKKGALPAPRSQLPAQPKGDMPFGNKRSREWNDFTRHVRQRTSTMKRNNAITGHYRKSKRRKRVQDPRGVVNVYDDHDDFSSDNALYLYAQDFGSSDRAINIGVQAIVKAALATIHIYPTNPAFLITTGSPMNELQIRFRRTRGVNPVYEDVNNEVTVNGSTFQSVCDEMFTFFKSRAQTAYYPYAFRFEGGDRGNEYRSLGDSTITLTASTVMQIQNTTQADATTTVNRPHDSHSITSNPLKGKVYRTRGFVPYIRPSITHNNAGLVGFHEAPASGVNHAVTVSDTSFMNHPPVGTTVFRNCTGSRLVKMQAGSIMPIRSYFKTKMTIINYFKKVCTQTQYDADVQPNMFGTCTVLGLEQSMRSALDESVKIGFNREITMKAYVRLKTRVPTIHSYKSTGSLE